MCIRDSYKDDKQQLSSAMMDLYKKEKINPAAGCLPMLVQIPFFMAFYWVLLESVEMRQAPFMLWINDLSSRDPFFVLPAIMAAAMFAQYKLNPAPPDPVQAKVFMIMPFAMSVMFAFFPAGVAVQRGSAGDRHRRRLHRRCGAGWVVGQDGDNHQLVPRGRPRDHGGRRRTHQKASSHHDGQPFLAHLHGPSSGPESVEPGPWHREFPIHRNLAGGQWRPCSRQQICIPVQRCSRPHQRACRSLSPP